MTKKELALEVIKRLKTAYPDADCTLDYDQAWKLLVSVRLASPVYRCKGKCSSTRSFCQISKCKGPGFGSSGRDRGYRKALRSWQKQGKRYQCLYENAS